MHLFCTFINNAYKSYFSFLYIPFKTKYILILDKLVLYNLLSYEVISKKYIKVNLRYYNNKALFFLELVSKGGNKLYLKKTKQNYNLLSKSTSSCLYLYSTSFGIFTSWEYIKDVGGKGLIRVKFLDKNIN